MITTHTIIAAFVFGGLLKVYDDMEDIPVIAQHASSQLIEIVKAFIIASLTYVSIHNMNVPLLIFIAHLVHCLVIDDRVLVTDFYLAGMMITLCLFILTFDLSQWNTTAIVIPLILFMVGGYMDHTFFPEEYSWKKIIWRALCGVSVLVALSFSICMPYCDIVSFFLGYCALSVVLMIYAQSSETAVSDEKAMLSVIETSNI